MQVETETQETVNTDLTENQVADLVSQNLANFGGPDNPQAMRQMAEMQAEAYAQLVGLHLDQLMGIMVSTNGVSFQRKVQAAKAIKEAFSFALDFGIGVTNAEIRDKGAPLAKQTNELAAILVKAFDNRMLLLADNLRQAEEDKEVQNIQEETNVQGEQ